MVTACESCLALTLQQMYSDALCECAGWLQGQHRRHHSWGLRFCPGLWRLWLAVSSALWPPISWIWYQCTSCIWPNSGLAGIWSFLLTRLWLIHFWCWRSSFRVSFNPCFWSKHCSSVWPNTRLWCTVHSSLWRRFWYFPKHTSIRGYIQSIWSTHACLWCTVHSSLWRRLWYFPKHTSIRGYIQSIWSIHACLWCTVHSSLWRRLWYFPKHTSIWGSIWSTHACLRCQRWWLWVWHTSTELLMEVCLWPGRSQAVERSDYP